MRNIRKIAGQRYAGKAYKLPAFQAEGSVSEKAGNVADPWYSNDFDTTWRDVVSGCRNLLVFLNHVYSR